LTFALIKLRLFLRVNLLIPVPWSKFQERYHATAEHNTALLLDRLGNFVVVPSSTGGNSAFEQHSQCSEGRATFDRYYHFHEHTGMCA
jgi:hypothetical protein